MAGLYAGFSAIQHAQTLGYPCLLCIEKLRVRRTKVLSRCRVACNAGQYDEAVFKAIDYILDQMSQQGIRVIVAFIDYWKKTDGVQQVRPPGHHAAAVPTTYCRVLAQ